MLTLLSTQNIVSTHVTEGKPWEFQLPEAALAAARKLSKVNRRLWLNLPETVHNCYSAFRASDETQRVATANEVVGIRALVIDFDVPTTYEAVKLALSGVKPQFLPTFVEISLGQKARGVWLFEKELLAVNSQFAEDVLRQISKVVGAEIMLAGFDEASYRVTQLWTNGCEWYNTGKQLSDHIVQGAAIKVLEKFNAGYDEVPLATIAEEVQKRFPNRWEGDFVTGMHGVRFWDPKADNPRGAYVTPAGMYCFTGDHAPFVSWSDIFGTDWVGEQRALNLGRAAAGLFFDGKFYWKKNADRWVNLSREDTLLELSVGGMARSVRKGQTASDADRVLKHIQTANRVESALPLVFRPDGIGLVNGERILNTSTLRALPPSPEGASTEDFPWLKNYIWNLFERTTLFSLDYFLTWLQRAYSGALAQKPLNGQAVFFCGPRNNGKTLLCMRIICPLLGGKAANPFDYLMKQTQFNSEIFSAGLLAINDEDAPHTEKDKEVFLQRLKSMVVNHKHTYHPKFRDRMELEWIGRLVITLNDDPKSAAMLPEINHNTEDKLLFFATKGRPDSWPSKYELEAIISKELPHFARWLLDTYVPLDDIVDTGSRMGMKSFHDPVLVEMSKQQETAHGFREILLSWVAHGGYWTEPKLDAWEGTATDLLSTINDTGLLQTVVKEWTVLRAARALTSLARVDPDTVSTVPGSDRIFRINKAPLIRK